MTAELTAEQIVTNLLSANEIIKPQQENFYITDEEPSLGEFLLNQPQAEENIKDPELTKYSFIKGRWLI